MKGLYKRETHFAKKEFLRMFNEIIRIHFIS